MHNPRAIVEVRRLRGPTKALDAALRAEDQRRGQVAMAAIRTALAGIPHKRVIRILETLVKGIGEWIEVLGDARDSQVALANAQAHIAPAYVPASDRFARADAQMKTGGR